MCILLYLKLTWCSGIQYTYGQLEGVYISTWYMCILLYIKLIWCSGIPYIYGQLEEGAMVYMHSGICETYMVQWYFINVWSIVGGYMCHGYMCILLYVKLIWCSGITWMYDQMEEAGLGISASFYM